MAVKLPKVAVDTGAQQLGRVQTQTVSTPFQNFTVKQSMFDGAARKMAAQGAGLQDIMAGLQQVGAAFQAIEADREEQELLRRERELKEWGIERRKAWVLPSQTSAAGNAGHPVDPQNPEGGGGQINAHSALGAHATDDWHKKQLQDLDAHFGSIENDKRLSPAAQRAWETKKSNVRLQMMQDAANHQIRQQAIALDEEYAATIANAEAAAVSATTPEMMEARITEMVDVVQRRGRRQGWSDAQMQNEIQAATQSALSKSIMNFLDSKDVDGAKLALKRGRVLEMPGGVKITLRGEVIEQLETAINAKDMLGKADDAANAVYRAGRTIQDMRRDVQKLGLDQEQEDEVMRRIKVREAERRDAETQIQSDALRSAQNKVLSEGVRPDDLPSQLIINMGLSNFNALRGMDATLRIGPDVPETIQTQVFVADMLQDPNFGKMDAGQVAAAAAGKVSRAQLNTLLSANTKARSTLASGKSKGLTDAQAGTSLNMFLPVIGIDKKDDPDKYIAWYMRWTEHVEARREAGNPIMTQGEAAADLQSMITAAETFGDVEAPITVGGVPDAATTRIVQALDAEGIEVNARNIRRMYRRILEDGTSPVIADLTPADREKQLQSINSTLEEETEREAEASLFGFGGGA